MAITNVLLALATIFFTMTIVQDVVCAIIVVIFVFLIAFNLIGTVWFTNWLFGGFIIEINAISVVNLVTCLGLAVEFVAHIVVKFRTSTGNKWERVTDAMSTMGTSVFVGIACTKFIGVAVLGFAPSTLFKLYYFRMYILMVGLGSFNVRICKILGASPVACVFRADGSEAKLVGEVASDNQYIRERRAQQESTDLNVMNDCIL